MSFKLEVNAIPERCDKCQLVSTEERPMAILTARSFEQGRVTIWVHLDELERAVALAKKRFEKWGRQKMQEQSSVAKSEPGTPSI